MNKSCTENIIGRWKNAISGKISETQLFQDLKKAHPPLTSVTFTRACSMGCKHCVYPPASKSDIKQNNLRRIEKTIEATRKAGVRDLIHVGRTLQQEHIAILKQFQQKGMTINLIDNGLGARFVPQIKEVGLYFDGGIDISIDGDEKTHDFQRRPGGYKSALKGAKKLKNVADHISVTGTASCLNYKNIVQGLADLKKELPFVQTFQFTTTSPTNFQPCRMHLTKKQMLHIFNNLEKTAKTQEVNLLIYRLEDIAAILPRLVKYGQPKMKYISIEWVVGKSKVEFFPQSIVPAEEFAIDNNGRHIPPFGLDWHLDNRPEIWEIRNDLILTDPDKSYELLVEKYHKTIGRKVFEKEKLVFSDTILTQHQRKRGQKEISKRNI